MANTFVNATLKANTSGYLKMLDASAETTSSLITRGKILPGSTLVWDKPINLETLDSIRLAPDRNNSTEVVASVLQIT